MLCNVVVFPSAEPDSVDSGRSGGGVVRQEEAVGCGGAGSHRERIQTGTGGQTLLSTGIVLIYQLTVNTYKEVIGWGQ